MTQQTWGAPPQGQPAWGQPPQQPQQQWGQPAGQPQQAWGGQQAPAAGPTQTAQDFFMGGGKGEPGFDFGATQNAGKPKLGSQIMGTIVEISEPHQQRSFDGNKPMFFEDGTPRMQVAVTLQTDLTGWAGIKPDLIPTDEQTGQQKHPAQDTGLRRIFIKGDMQRAVREAARKAGRAPEVGDRLAVVVAGFKDVGKGNPLTLYQAALELGSGAAQTSFFQQEQPQQAAPAQGYPGPQAAAPYVGVPTQPNGTPEGFPGQQQAPAPGYEQPQGQGYAPAPEQAPQGQQFPAALGNGQAPTAPPDWAQQQPAPQGGAPTYDRPPF